MIAQLLERSLVQSCSARRRWPAGSFAPDSCCWCPGTVGPRGHLAAPLWCPIIYFLYRFWEEKKKKKSAEDFIYMPSFVVIQISRVGIRISFFPGRYLIISEQRIAGAENPTPTFTKMPPFSASSAPWSGSAHGEGRNKQPPNFISQVNAVRKCFWRRKVRFLGNRFWNGSVDLNTDPNQDRCPL